MRILLAGGAGYIGSHVAVALAEAGHVPIVVDNLSNSSPVAVERVATIVAAPVGFHRADVRHTELLRDIVQRAEPDAVVHLAGLKAVGESVQHPWHYYDNNLRATLSLLEVLRATGVPRLLFSSSATVYAPDQPLPLTEEARTGGITNPYGWTKYFIEQILRDVAASDPAWQVALLRYFNPVGAHSSGLIGEDPTGRPNNLLPFVEQVAAGRYDRVEVFGDDYDTVDGTGVRDYIHIMDLARGHVAALEHLAPGVATYNLGTGRGTSVLELIHAFEAANGLTIPYQIVPRRPGDLATTYCSPAKAERDLGWRATHTIEDACRDAWRWRSANPTGYPRPA